MGMRVAVGVAAKRLLAADGPVDVSFRDLVFLRQTMGKDRQPAPVKEVQDAVRYVSELGAKFVDLIAEQVGLRASQVVPQLLPDDAAEPRTSRTLAGSDS